MSDKNDYSEFVSFTQLTPEDILKLQNRTVILTPREKFERIYKLQDKRLRRLRKYHFVAVETTNNLYVFDGEGVEICVVENSVKGYSHARLICLEMFLNSPNQNGGYTFTGPNYENLTDEELEQAQIMTMRNLEYKKFTQDEMEEYFIEPKFFCFDCLTKFNSNYEMTNHVCTEQFVILQFAVHSKNFARDERTDYY